MFDEFFTKAHELAHQGVPFATALVVRAEKPTSAKPGDKAIITVEGVMYGWIGGSCAQPVVIKEALKSLADDESRLVRLSTEPESQLPREGLIDLPMTCFSGGTLEIFIEPQHPRPRLLIVGNLPVARALAELGSAMNYHVIVVDPEGKGEGLPRAEEVLTDLDVVAEQIRPFTYVVIASHGNYDELALEKILPHHPPYAGLVASPSRAKAVRRYLVEQGISETEMLALKAPAGLDIQARRGDEIALSIMAEIVQKRRNAELLNLELFHKQTSAAQEGIDLGGHLTDEAEPSSTAVDPVCQMEVEIDSAKYFLQHEGETYYFCCAGCKSKFSENPVPFAKKQSSIES